ncbi:MFS transporter [Holzapfeliella sp. JNUCC 80]
MDNVLKRNMRIYFVSYLLDIASISLIHSILTILLLNKGLSLSNIVTIQTGYSIAVLLFEFPSGVLGDVFSRKKVNLISKFFLLLMFVLVIFSNSFMLMMLAWFFYGTYAALNSGTLENDIINHIKTKKPKTDIPTFIRYQNIVRLITMISASFIGAFIYYQIGINIYLISIGLLLTSFICSCFFYSEQDKESDKSTFEFKNIIEHVKGSFREVKEKRYLKLLLIVSFSSQIFFQTHFQLWQGLFLEKSINERFFPFIYIIFQIISIIAYSYPIKKHRFTRNFVFRIAPIILALPMMLLLRNNLLFLILYYILILILTLVEYVSDYLFSEMVSMKAISSLTSLKSVISRISSILILLISGMLINFFDVLSVVIFNFILSIFLILTLFTQVKKDQ